ncbi:ataxin-3 [Capsaspora owczarzaki ATCC 30864]|uniref:Ataxin-3 homolog n=2 Tax=Capsaspora owczarzaki (strain ATCC 30864) TaxID=595528 RepID=A0A0D2VTP4_CAPO3|nr:ataxin-3 [Capsaspora owczarzaki ATCC 30864]
MALSAAEVVFHEQQQGALCAQHCLNAMLQGSYFSAVDLADIARQLDAAELSAMAEGGYSRELAKFARQGSSNMDDSGFFSIQVITQALNVWGIKCVPFMSEDAVDARRDPTHEQGFICNRRQHWFSIRRFGPHWANLDSTLKGPNFITGTYLTLFLNQLQSDGYSIFVIRGNLPPSAADAVLSQLPASQIPNSGARTSGPAAPSAAPRGNIHTLSSLSASRSSSPAQSGQTIAKHNSSGTSGLDSVHLDPETIQSLAAGVKNANQPAAPARPVDMDEMRAKRLQRFGNSNAGK